MARTKKDPVREQRITMEIIVDAYDECERAMGWGDAIYTGLFYQKTGQPPLDDREPILKKGGPIATRKTGLSEDQVKKIIGRMM